MPDGRRTRSTGDLRVVRPWPGVDGLDVLGPAAALDALAWPGRRARRVRGVRGSSRAIPRAAGVDIDDTTIPQEAFLERDAVSFTKGCFLGQELVCRIDSRGHVNRFLRGLRSPTSRATGRRSAPRSSSTARSSARSRASPPAGDCRPVALGYVRREVEPPADGRRSAGTARPRAAPTRAAHRLSALTSGQAGIVTTKRVPPASRGSTAARRRPSPPRARGRSRARCRCRPCGRARRATCRAARTRAAGRSAAMPGPSSSTWSSTRPSRRVDADLRRSPVAYFNAFSTRLATICASRSGRRRPAPARRVASSSATPDLAPPRAGTPRRSSPTTRARVERRGVQRELVRVEPGEVEQVGDEALEPAGLGRDHVGGADAARRCRRRCRRRSPRRSRGST